jgi:two-component sensor histidine kinase
VIHGAEHRVKNKIKTIRSLNVNIFKKRAKNKKFGATSPLSALTLQHSAPAHAATLVLSNQVQQRHRHLAAAHTPALTTRQLDPRARL